MPYGGVSDGDSEGTIMPKHAIPTPNEARAGSKEGVVRYVLGISLGLAVVALVVAYFAVI